ncbi:hypothetical protein CP061683_0890B, partial [Chlamydia psittaci 06-1683]
VVEMDDVLWKCHL